MIPAIAPTSASEPSLGKRKAEETPGARKVQASATKAMETLEAGQKTLKAQQAWILTEIQRIGEFLQKGQETSTPATVKTSPLLSNRGGAYLYLHRYREALADAEKALEWDPSNLLARYNRGACYRELGRFKEALADASTLLEEGQNQGAQYAVARGFYLQGTVHMRQGSFSEAVGDFTRCIQNDPRGVWKQAPALLEQAKKLFSETAAPGTSK